MATNKKTATPVNEPEIEEKQEIQEEPTRKATAKETEMAEEIARLKAQLAQSRPKAGSMKSDFDRVKEVSEQVAAEGKDPWEVTVEVMVPHREKTEDPWYWINVNGLSVQIPANDRYQELKLPWANMLVDMLRAEKRSLDYQDSLEVFDPVVNPHK